MMTTISKTFDFDAAHRLDLLPPEHKCHRLHGHTYRVEVVLRGEATPPEWMFIDYAEIAKAWEPLHAMLDHRCLNEVPGIGHPTTEALATFIYWEFNKGPLATLLFRVRVYESSSTYCEVGF